MKILVSSCLLGENVRYDGTNNLIDDPNFKELIKDHQIIPFCPEVQGGLPTPRDPAEIQNGKVLTKKGENVSKAFYLGALKALEVCETEEITIALLKAKSPSCGNDNIYDGSFQSKLIEGSGIAAALLIENGIKVFNEKQLVSFYKALKAVH